MFSSRTLGGLFWHFNTIEKKHVFIRQTKHVDVITVNG